MLKEKVLNAVQVKRLNVSELALDVEGLKDGSYTDVAGHFQQMSVCPYARDASMPNVGTCSMK